MAPNSMQPSISPQQSAGHLVKGSTIISLFFLALGSAAANQLIPDQNYGEPGALAAAASTLIFTLLATLIFFGGNSTITRLRAENILMLGLVYWLLLDVIFDTSGTDGLSREVTVQAFHAVETFAFALWLGSSIDFPGRVARFSLPILSGASAESEAAFLYRASVASGILGLARYFIGCRFDLSCIADSLYASRFVPAWQGPGAFPHYLNTLFFYTQYFGFVAGPLVVALIRAERGVSTRAIFPILLSLACLFFMFRGGGRKDVGTVVGAAMIVWLLLGERLRLKHLILSAVTIAGLIVVMQAMLVARDSGIGNVLDGTVSIFDEETPLGRVDGNFQMLSYVINFVPERVPFDGWRGVVFYTTVSIPYGEVPTRGLNLAYELGWWRGQGWTWACSAVGDFYLIGGFPVIFLGGLLFGTLARVGNNLLRQPMTIHQALLYSLYAMTLFLAIRSLAEFFVTGAALAVYLGIQFTRRYWSSRPSVQA